MRKGGLIVTAFLLCFFVILGGVSSRAELVVKIGYVDVQKVFEEYRKKEDLEARLKLEQGKAQQSLEEKRKEIERLQEDLIRQEMMLSELARMEKQNELRNETKELEKLAQSIQADLQKKWDLYTQEIVNDIMAAAKEIAEKEGYRLIFDKRVLLYATPEVEFDLTQKVLSQLNQRYQPE